MTNKQNASPVALNLTVKRSWGFSNGDQPVHVVCELSQILRNPTSKNRSAQNTFTFCLLNTRAALKSTMKVKRKLSKTKLKRRRNFHFRDRIEDLFIHSLIRCWTVRRWQTNFGYNFCRLILKVLSDCKNQRERFKIHQWVKIWLSFDDHWEQKSTKLRECHGFPTLV
jgi:hypothetical protein